MTGVAGHQKSKQTDHHDSSDDDTPTTGAAATDQLAAAAKEEQENLRAKLLKKRIQVAEGERKALWQDCEQEKVANKNRIAVLKEEIKCLHECIKEARTVKYEKVLTEANYERSKTIVSAIKNLPIHEALSFVEYKKADKRKILDKLEFEMKKLEDRLSGSKVELTKLKKQAEKTKEDFENSAECHLARTLENKVYKTQANLTEAEHVYSKYESIRDKLVDESHSSQAELQELIAQINKQDAEIDRLRVTHESSIISRDNLKANLTQLENQVTSDRQHREVKLNYLKKQMEEHQAKANAQATVGGPGMLDAWGTQQKFSISGPSSPFVAANPVQGKEQANQDYFFSDLDPMASEYSAPSSAGKKSHFREGTRHEFLWESLRETEISALLDSLKNRLGASNWQEMMERCRDQESRKLHLEKVKAETLMLLGLLRAKKESLEVERDQLKFKETERMNEHKSDLVSTEEMIAEERNRVEECKVNQQGIIDALTEIKQGAIHLLEILQPVPDEQNVPLTVSLELQPEEIPEMLNVASRKIESLQRSIILFNPTMDHFGDVGSTSDTRLSHFNTRVAVVRSRNRSGNQSLASGKDKDGMGPATLQAGDQESDSGEEQDIPTRVGIKRQSKKLIELNKGQARAVAEKVAASKRR